MHIPDGFLSGEAAALGGVVAATVSGQLVVSATLDRYGFLGLDRIGLTPARLAGFALLLAGTALVTWR